MVLAAAAFAAALSATVVVAQTPLVEKRFNYTALPYKVDTDTGLVRGLQSGYNRCNSTTATQTSLCQTAIINSLDDFCLWGPQEPNGIVGNIEGEMVAWCTKGSKYGARQIPAGALQGVTFVKTPHYVQVTGFINQEQIYIASNDDGGEMDPHGADNRGNPLGGLLFTQAFNGNLQSTAIVNGSAFTQVVEWHNFMGANQFCLKACDPSYSGDAALCQHIFDRVGCNVNAPMVMKNGTFESCLGDDQLPPGVYVQGGQTLTYTQPPEGQVISTLPYVPFTPSSSSCTTFSSAALYATAAASSSTMMSSAMSSASSRASSAAGSASSGTARASSAVASGASRASSAASAAATSARPSGAANNLAVSGGLLGAAMAAVLAL